MFPTEYLRHDPNNPLPSQANAPPPLIKVTADDEYEVQEVIIVKLVWGKLVYRAKWTGVDKDPEFYLISDFKYSLHLLKSFYLANPILPNLPTNLPLWLKA